LQELDIAIEKQAESRYARYLRSLVLIRKSEYRAAVQEIQGLFELEDSERDSMGMSSLSQNFAVALRHYQTEKNGLPEKAQKRLEKGICDLYTKYYRGATTYFEQALASTDESCMSCHYFLGMSLEQSFQRVEAERHYSIALELQPEVFELYQRRGQLLDKMGRWQLALADYSKALKLRPEEYQLHKNRGHIQMQLGQYNMAVLDYNYFLAKQDSTDMQVLFNRAVCYKELKYFDNAIKDLSVLLDKEEKDLEAYYERAYCYYRNKAPEESKADLDSLLLTNSFYPTAHNLRGLILLEEGAYDGALYHFSQAISQRKGYQEACFNKYLAYRGLENYKGALHCMDELIEIDAENGLYFFHRGYVKKQLGITTACDDLEKALALGLSIEQEAKELICTP
ncbi:MAG: tetratricopeptide repeat protein, partial [Saprospiraceae bacterium]|nr:tetratricopeptide repeat protein [Saprospiraceae bacterium]